MPDVTSLPNDITISMDALLAANAVTYLSQKRSSCLYDAFLCRIDRREVDFDHAMMDVETINRILDCFMEAVK